ncbi:MAG: hypothetical protein LBL31_05115 [Spirochaetaceae bacterium]|jgi:hypothetical protein|nr:hypothetical protein [Spirochaetaceae bacterium]
MKIKTRFHLLIAGILLVPLLLVIVQVVLAWSMREQEEENACRDSEEKADNQEMNKEKASLVSNIDDILNGTPERKRELEKHIFFMADTPALIKKSGVSGDYFSVRYGVITRHKRKDADHNLTAENWKCLCGAITRPFSIARHGNGYRLFTDVKINKRFICAVVDVRSIGHGLEVNALQTAFGFRGKAIKDVIYTSEDITPEQAALLGETNILVYPSAPNGDTSLSSNVPDKSSPENNPALYFQLARAGKPESPPDGAGRGAGSAGIES